jgi:hypothetical protein
MAINKQDRQEIESLYTTLWVGKEEFINADNHRY